MSEYIYKYLSNEYKIEYDVLELINPEIYIPDDPIREMVITFPSLDEIKIINYFTWEQLINKLIENIPFGEVIYIEQHNFTNLIDLEYLDYINWPLSYISVISNLDTIEKTFKSYSSKDLTFEIELTIKSLILFSYSLVESYIANIAYYLVHKKNNTNKKLSFTDQQNVFQKKGKKLETIPMWKELRHELVHNIVSTKLYYEEKNIFIQYSLKSKKQHQSILDIICKLKSYVEKYQFSYENSMFTVYN